MTGANSPPIIDLTLDDEPWTSTDNTAGISTDSMATTVLDESDENPAHPTSHPAPSPSILYVFQEVHPFTEKMNIKLKMATLAHEFAKSGAREQGVVSFHHEVFTEEALSQGVSATKIRTSYAVIFFWLKYALDDNDYDSCIDKRVDRKGYGFTGECKSIKTSVRSFGTKLRDFIEHGVITVAENFGGLDIFMEKPEEQRNVIWNGLFDVNPIVVSQIMYPQAAEKIDFQALYTLPPGHKCEKLAEHGRMLFIVACELMLVRLQEMKNLKASVVPSRKLTTLGDQSKAKWRKDFEAAAKRNVDRNGLSVGDIPVHQRPAEGIGKKGSIKRAHGDMSYLGKSQ